MLKMKSVLQATIVTWLSMMATVACAQATNYEEITAPKVTRGDQVEVVEFFMYTCPHCYDFETHIGPWSEKVPEGATFVRIPATFRPEFEIHARAYYAAEMMDVLDKLHMPFFKAIHEQGKPLNTKESISALADSVGIDGAALAKNMDSFVVETKLRKGQQILKDYQLRGVPAVAVNGKYMITSRAAQSYEGMISAINETVALEQ